MELQKGRLIDHVHLRVRDVEKSRVFFEAVLNALGHQLTNVTEDSFSANELHVSKGVSYRSRLHIAFQAMDEEAVKRFYNAALENGGNDNGAPGPRRYHIGYFGAFVLDPDGNNIEAVFHGKSD